jgi:hypothetical protein
MLDSAEAVKSASAAPGPHQAPGGGHDAAAQREGLHPMAPAVLPAGAGAPASRPVRPGRQDSIAAPIGPARPGGPAGGRASGRTGAVHAAARVLGPVPGRRAGHSGGPGQKPQRHGGLVQDDAVARLTAWAMRGQPFLWRSDRYGVRMDDSVGFEGFLAGARKFAALAIAARAGDDQSQFAFNAGIAVEHLAKAVLAREAPDLLSKQASAAEVISRLRALGVLSSDDMLDQLRKLRNSVAHAKGTAITEDLLPTFARTVEILLEHVGESEEQFWGTWRPPVTGPISGVHDKVAQDVYLRIQNAKNLFIARDAVKPGGDFDEYEGRSSDDRPTYELGFFEDYMQIVKRVECPACAKLARLKMTAAVDDITDDRALFTMDQLFCSHCRLRLTGRAEIEAAGLASSIAVNLNERPWGDERSQFADQAQFYIRNRDHYAKIWRDRGERRRYAERGALGAESNSDYERGEA